VETTPNAKQMSLKVTTGTPKGTPRRSRIGALDPGGSLEAQQAAAAVALDEGSIEDCRGEIYHFLESGPVSAFLMTSIFFNVIAVINIPPNPQEGYEYTTIEGIAAWVDLVTTVIFTVEVPRADQHRVSQAYSCLRLFDATTFTCCPLLS